MFEGSQSWITIAVAVYAVVASIAAITPTKKDDDALNRLKNLAMPIINLLSVLGFLKQMSGGLKSPLFGSREVIVEAAGKYEAMAKAAELLGSDQIDLAAEDMGDGKWSVKVSEVPANG